MDFNIGVELGQTAVIALTVALLAVTRRLGGLAARDALAAASAAVVLALGIAWTFGRSVGA